MKNIFFVCIVLLFNKCNALDKDSVKKALNSQSTILYLEIDKDNTQASPREGRVVLYDLISNSKTYLTDGFNEDQLLRLKPNTNKIIFFERRSLISPVISELDVITLKKQTVNFRSRLKYRDDFGFTYNFDFINDSSITFGFRDTLYAYLFDEDKLSKIKGFEGLNIGSVSVNKDKQLIAFTYQYGADSLRAESLGIYDLENDVSYLYDSVDVFVQHLWNWSPDYSKLIFGQHEKIVIYDIVEKTFEYLNRDLGSENMTINNAYFLTNDELVINITKSLDAINYVSYLCIYDLREKKIVKKIIDDDCIIENISMNHF